VFVDELVVVGSIVLSLRWGGIDPAKEVDVVVGLELLQVVR
jgi:hypothetical protein